MPKFAIAFHSPQDNFVHKIVEMDTREAAVNFFFHNYVGDEYTKDDEGYNYFSEDFNDSDSPLGSIIDI
jgi:hypothetical protein